nr:C10 family peptidase [Bacteroidota bacterium]
IMMVLFSLSLFAERVSENDASTVGKNYYWENSRTQNPIDYDEIIPDLFTTINMDGKDLYYVFNINRSDGFVIVAADDDVTPILGYSLNGAWTGENIPPSLQMILNSFAKQISAVITEGIDGGSETDREWLEYSKFNPAPPAPRAITPLLSTTWNQSYPYNNMCPTGTYAGCVAVSMAQVLKYWSHPTQGTGSHCYTHPTYGTLCANFGATTYSFTSMPASLSSPDTEICQLLYHCGISVDMNYGTSGSAPSGTNWDTDIENALKNYFSYSSQLGWKWKNNFNVTTWINMLKAELDQFRPMIYYGWDGGNNAHAFNCDGYNNSNLFHFNLGWGGSYDGYYAVTNLNPYYNFTYSQAAIFGMYPVVNYAYDFGDAPDPGYPTKLTSFGAQHVVPSQPTIFLGSLVDTEPDGQPDVNCVGDDNDLLYPPANDDEDGVVIPTLYQGSSATIGVLAFSSGYLNAWMDFNQDGDWADPGEQIFTSKLLSNGYNNLSLPVPASAWVGWTYARFRYSSVPNLGFTGQAPDGEVEDYFVRIDEEGTGGTLQNILFSVDIGSDTEMSDPQQDMDEVFDPGDAYVFQGAFIPLPGADGYFDDAQAFGNDPFPDGGVPGTNAMCLSGIPIGQVSSDYFDMDGLDMAECDLRQYPFGEGMPSVEKFDDPFIHVADSLLISFDDDDAFPYTDLSGSIPMLGYSPTGQIYGQSQNMDEILEVDVNPIAAPQVSVQSVTPKYDEVNIHVNLTPDPNLFSANQNVLDDDVDALDAPFDFTDLARTYFSADHEATGVDATGMPLNPGSIYLAENGMTFEVINAQTDIGLPDGTDIDAFEFTWMMDPQYNYVALAMIFSVDDDDPTTGVDESGGLMPNQIYLTFMTGFWIDFTTEHFEDDIDAIAIVATVAGSQQGPKADFSPLNKRIYAGMVIQFFDLSTNNPTSWNWTFNGGIPATHNGQLPPLVAYPTPGIYQVSLTVANASGSDTKSGTITVLPSSWYYTPTSSSHLISIPLSASPTVNGNPLNAGDEIGVFYTDLAGNVFCGGSVTWDGVNNVSLTAYGDDPTTPGLKDGFTSGEDFTWKVLPMSTMLETNVSVTYDNTMPNYDGKYYNNGVSALLSLSSFLTQSITLLQGWSGLSSYLQPVDNTLDSIIAPIQPNFTILLSMAGMYWPAQGINTIGLWNPYEGYKVKVANDVVLNIKGSTIQNRSIILNPGWHIIPVLSSGSVSTASILSSPNVVLAKEIAGGKVYWPAMSIFTLGALEPGKAYVILVSATTTISFPLKSSFAGSGTNPVSGISSPWNIVEPTPNSHIVVFPADFTGKYDKGDIIGAFNIQGLNTGMAVVTGENIAMTIWGDDPTTLQVDGMVEGEGLFFKIYRTASSEIEIPDVNFDASPPQPNKYFTIDGLSEVDATTGFTESTEIPEIYVYPNPTSDYLNISFEKSTSGCKVMVFNTLGEIVLVKEMIFDSEIRLDVSTWPEGCYFLKVSNETISATEKIIIRK